MNRPWFYPLRRNKLSIFMVGFFMGGILGILIMDVIHKGIL